MSRYARINSTAIRPNRWSIQTFRQNCQYGPKVDRTAPSIQSLPILGFCQAMNMENWAMGVPPEGFITWLILHLRSKTRVPQSQAHFRSRMNVCNYCTPRSSMLIVARSGLCLRQWISIPLINIYKIGRRDNTLIIHPWHVYIYNLVSQGELHLLGILQIM